MRNYYYLSERYYDEINGKSVCKRWFIRISKIEFCKKGEETTEMVYGTTNIYPKDFVIISGVNIVTEDFHYTVFSVLPPIYIKKQGKFKKLKWGSGGKMSKVEIVCEKCGVRFIHFTAHRDTNRKKFCQSCLDTRQRTQARNHYNKEVLV